MGFTDCCIPPKESREPIRYDPHFNGPIHNRSCTDIIWLVLFICFLGVWGYVGWYGMSHGNIQKLLAPIDSTGARCGMDSNVTDKPYLVFFDISKCLQPGSPIVGCPTPQVCVKKCPSKSRMFLNEMNVANFDEYRSYMVCTNDINVNTTTYAEAVQYINDNKCASYVLKSQEVLSRCIGDLSTLQCQGDSKLSPKSVSPVTSCVRNPSEARKSLVNRATVLDTYVGWIVASWMSFFTKADELDTHILSAQIVQDLVQSRWYLLGAVFGVVILCFLYILLLRWVVGPIVWASIVGLIGLMGFCVYLCYKNYAYYKDNPTLHQTTNLKGYAESIFSKPETWMVITIIAAVLLVFLVLIVIFLRKRITIAIALIREGSKAVTAIKSTIFFPIFPWLIQCCVIAYGVLVLMYLLSIGEPAFKTVNFANDTCVCNKITAHYTKDNEACDPLTFMTGCGDQAGGACKIASCHFTGLDSPHSVVGLHLANLLGFFWTMFFISGVSDMMLAATFSTWYWTYKKRDLPFFTLTSGIWRTFRYHLGTVALGALIIAIVRVIRVILEWVDQKLKKFDNPLTKCLMCCCKCFCWCLENFLKFINKNAYIMCAVHGSGFCKSAREAFSLLMRNIVRVVVIDKVTDFLFFLSKLLISVGVGVGVYYLLQWNLFYEVTQGQPLHYNHIPAIILSIVTYLICTIFFNVYEMAVDTLFLCFLEDCERNDGSLEKPYFMSKNLMKILGKRNKKL